MAKDLYAVLGVSRDASAEDIKKSYRKLARQYHPDLHPGDKEAETKFKEVQAAYDILGDEEKRSKYDQFGEQAFNGGPPPGGPWGNTGGDFQWSSTAGGDFQFDDLLSSLFGKQRPGAGNSGASGRGRRSNAGRSPFSSLRGEDIQVQVRIPFRLAMLGGSYDLSIGGPRPQNLEIKIPAGVQEGAKLRLAGKGNPSPTDGESGDLLVIVSIVPDPLLRAEGADVYLEAPVTVAEALLGSSMDVPTLEGKVSVNIPPGTSSGQKLRLRGRGGMTKFGDRGDQYVEIKIVVPKNIDEESKGLIRRLDTLNPMRPRETW